MEVISVNKEAGSVIPKAVVSLRMSPGLIIPMTLNLKDMSNLPLPKGHSLDKLSERKLKELIAYAEHKFSYNSKSVVGIYDQFCRFLSTECDKLLNPVFRDSLTTEQMSELKGFIKDCHGQLERKACVFPGTVKDAISFQYHDGFNHLTRDDDFIAVRCGDKIVSIIALPGNDFNDLKKFLLAGGEKVLSPENVVNFRKAVRLMKRDKAFELAQRRTKKVFSSGLSLFKK